METNMQIQPSMVSSKIETGKRLAETVNVPIFALVVGMICSSIDMLTEGMSSMTHTLNALTERANQFSDTVIEAAQSGDMIPGSKSIVNPESQAAVSAAVGKASIVGSQSQIMGNDINQQSYLMRTMADYMKANYYNGVVWITQMVAQMARTRV